METDRHEYLRTMRWPLSTLRKFSPARTEGREVARERHAQRCPRCFLRRLDAVAYECEPISGSFTLECQCCGWAANVGGWSTNTAEITYVN